MYKERNNHSNDEKYGYLKNRNKNLSQTLLIGCNHIHLFSALFLVF